MISENQSLKSNSKPIIGAWRGLGLWNLYFILKLALLGYGYLNFHPLDNLVFAAFLLFPLASNSWHKLRQFIAIPVGFLLLWHDTWLPGFNSIKSQAGQLAGFDALYWLDLLNRFINWQMVGVGFVLMVGYLFFSQWIRITLFVLLALVWLNINSLTGLSAAFLPSASPTNVVTNSANISNSANNNIKTVDEALQPTNTNLDAYLAQFYQNQKTAMTQFPASLPQDAEPFDILVINICSLAWADLESVKLDTHPLWQQFDVLFENFNSVTSYSAPSSIRLLRASCGQTSHKDIYSPINQKCYLFDNLAQLGFTTELILDHSGDFGNYLDKLRSYGAIQAPLQSFDGINSELTGFDGSPIYSDTSVLNRWMQLRQNDSAHLRSATFFNAIPLHDGDRFINSSETAAYQPRAQMFLDSLSQFLTDLEKSGRKVVVIVVPEHGAALIGDKVQVSGLRDIPSPNITHIPVGIKFVNIKANKPAKQIQITAPSSYLAISEIVARLVDGKLFTQSTIDWSSLVQNLPETQIVSENENAIVIKYQDKYYMRLDGGDWVPYPQS